MGEHANATRKDPGPLRLGIQEPGNPGTSSFIYIFVIIHVHHFFINVELNSFLINDAY